MSQITDGVRSILSSPRVYSLFQDLMGARSGWRRIVHLHLRPRPGDTLLDVGCGPGDVLDYLPKVRYWGYDISPSYIARAQARGDPRATFQCRLLDAAELAGLPPFDLVLASGLLHHLEDGEASALMRLARDALKPGGRLVTVDPCLVDGQNPIARFLIERDRGRNVRDEPGYRTLALAVFSDVRSTVRHKAWIPYTHCYMECTRT